MVINFAVTFLLPGGNPFLTVMYYKVNAEKYLKTRATLRAVT